MKDEWGVGDKANAVSFATATVEGQEVELLFGEHPHSRRDNNEYARFPDGAIQPFSGHRVAIGVEIQESNYLKESHYSGDEVRRSCAGIITFNGEAVGEVSGREILPTLLSAYQQIQKLQDLPFNLADPKDRAALIGRKIWYREIPAVITSVILDQGCVIIAPDGAVFPPPAYYKADDGDLDDPSEWQTAKVEFESKSIWWFRG